MFITTAIAGALLIFWTMKTGEPPDSLEDVSIEQNIAVEDRDDNESGDEVFIEELSKMIPSGMKAVSLPVSIFGDASALKEGDKVDIISTYYDREAGILDSEKIISAREIVALETTGEPSKGDGMSLGGSILHEDISLAGQGVDIGNVLVITFYLRDEEVLRSFKAIEGGILYLALCPAGKEEGVN